MNVNTAVMEYPPVGKKKSADASSEEKVPASETLRVHSDIMDMIRDIIYHDRDGRGRRYKLIQLGDELIRPVLTRRHREVMDRVERAKKDKQ